MEGLLAQVDAEVLFEGWEDVGVECGSDLAFDEVEGFRGRHCFAVVSVGRDGIEDIGKGHDSGAEWYGFALEAEWVAGTVEAFVMG